MVVGVVRAGHLADQPACHGRLRRALPLLLAVHAAGRPGGQLRSVEVRPEASAASLPARDHQRGACGVRPDDRPVAQRDFHRRLRARDRQRRQRAGQGNRCRRAGRFPRSPQAAGRTAAGLDVGPDGRRHDRSALERRPVPSGAPRRRLARQPRGEPAVHSQPDHLLRLPQRPSRARGKPCQSTRRRSRRSKATTRRRAPSTGRSACDRTSAGAPRSTRRTRATNRTTWRCTTT